MSGSFVQRQLEVRVTLRSGEFSSGDNTKIISGVPTKVSIEKSGPPDFNKAKIEVKGIIYEDMEKLTTLAFGHMAVARNVVAVYAGDEEAGLSLAFSGEVIKASADFGRAPDVTFNMEAMTGYYGSLIPIGPTAVSGQQTTSDFVSSMASRMGYDFRNDGVTTRLQNSYFSGSPIAQARAAAKQVGAELILDDDTMVLCPSGGSGNTGEAVALSKGTGLIGCPAVSSDGIHVKALYDPAFKLGGYIKLTSIVPKASGTWRIIKLVHDLSAWDPAGGPWESQITAFYPWGVV